MGWNRPRRVIIPWLESLGKLLSQVAMPDVCGQTLWVLTDYRYDNSASDFDVVGLLIADPRASGGWKHLRNDVRAKVLVDNRRMRWNKLDSDSLRKAAFLPFLRAADHIGGLALALAFQRGSAFAISDADLSRFRDSFELSVNCKLDNLQHLFRIAYCAAFLVAGMSSPGQDIHWVSDQDSVFANDTIAKDFPGVFSKLLTIFSPHTPGEVRYGTLAHAAEGLFHEDLAAVPDIMCGAACEVLTSIKRKYGDIPETHAALPKLTARTRKFLSWYAGGEWPLHRYICWFEARKGRSPSAGILHPALLGGDSAFPPPGPDYER